MNSLPTKLVFSRATGCAALLLTLAATSAGAAEPAWKPAKPVEFVAQNAPGGGSDRILRLMTKVLQEQKALDTPVAVVNKPAVWRAYLSQQNDGHHLTLSGQDLISTHLVGQGASFLDFTPVAHLFSEYVSVTVKPDSPLRNGADLIERLKKDVTSQSIGIATRLGGANHLGVAVALHRAGVDIKKTRNVIFPSGGAATTALMGGHLDVAPVTAAFAASLLRSKQVRVLVVAAPQRLGGVLADVPTWREQGYDAVVANWRALIGPKKMTAAQITYWENTFRRLSESEEWKKELAENFWRSEFLTGAETLKKFELDEAQLRMFYKELGLI
jgi:putative tricarboxylic transport membrane protein